MDADVNVYADADAENTDDADSDADTDMDHAASTDTSTDDDDDDDEDDDSTLVDSLLCINAEGRPAIRWPRFGSVIAFVWCPHTQVLHWMKRRRVLPNGKITKPNLLIQFLPLQHAHRYQFYMIQVPALVRVPGAMQGLLRRPGGGIPRRGPRALPRWPWHADTFASRLPSSYTVLEASEFIFTAQPSASASASSTSTSSTSSVSSFSTEDDTPDDVDQEVRFPFRSRPAFFSS
jgi:hypothetical protein